MLTALRIKVPAYGTAPMNTRVVPDLLIHLERFMRMASVFMSAALIAMLLGVSSCQTQSATSSTLEPQSVDVPEEFTAQSSDNDADSPPTPDSERTRYEKAFVAYWWRCVETKSERLEARCPFVCSGTPAAAAGCADGATAASRNISDHVERLGEARTRSLLEESLRSPAFRQDCATIRRYFDEMQCQP